MAKKTDGAATPSPKRDISKWTAPRQFRLAEDTMAELDWLSARLGGLSRSDVLRLAIRRLAVQEGYQAAAQTEPAPVGTVPDATPEPNTPERSFADALHDAHTSLLRDLQELEKAVGPTSREGPAELGTRLGKVRTHLADHFRFEEEGGYMAPVLKQEPRFRAEIQELLAEHSQMTQTLEAIIEEVSRGPTVQDGSRQKIHAWVGKVRHHETRENDLVHQAYYSAGATGD